MCSFKRNNKSNKNHIRNLIVDGTSFSKSEDIAEQLHRFFCNIGANLAKNLPLPKVHFTQYLNNSLSPSFYCDQIYPYEINNLLDSLKKKKTSGSDPFNADLIHGISQYIYIGSSLLHI